MLKLKKYLKATSILSGTIIGAGIFALPWTAVQSGFLTVSIYLFVLAILISILHLVYYQIVLSVPGKSRFPGYLGYFFGPKAKNFGALIIISLFWGSLLVYLILGGKFLSFIFGNPTNELLSTLIFFLLGSLPIFFGIKRISSLEFFSLIILFSIILFSFFWQKNQIPFSDFPKINFNKILLPYGIIIYSLFGLSAIPELTEFLKQKKIKLENGKKIIVLGTCLPAVFYFFFIVLFLRIVPANNITPDIIHSFNSILLPWLLKYSLAIFGLLAVLTSFWTIGLNLRNLFIYDFKIKKEIACPLACLVPLFLYFIKLRDFVSVISCLGSLIIGIQIFLIILIYFKKHKIQKNFNLKSENEFSKIFK